MALINNHIKSTPKTDDLTDEPIGRVLFFMGRRAGMKDNPQFDTQDVVFDVVMHEKYAANYQLEMAVDHLIKTFNGRQLGRFDRASDQGIGIVNLPLVAESLSDPFVKDMSVIDLYSSHSFVERHGNGLHDE